jgi:hypothetical protein
MDITKLPETLTYNQVKALRAAFGHFYDQESGAKFVDAKTGFHFDNVTGFVDYLYSPEIGIPKGTSVKHIGIVLESWYETLSKAPEFSEPTVTQAPRSAVNPNTLTKEQREQFEKELRAREISQKEASEKAKETVEVSIKRQQEIYTEQITKAKNLEKSLKIQKIYYKIESPPEKVSPEVVSLHEQAEINPKKFIEEVSTEITAKANTQNLTPEESAVIGQQTALTTYEVLTGQSPLITVAVIDKVISDPKILSTIAPDAKSQATLNEIAQNIVEQKSAQFELVKEFVDLPKIDGIINGDKINVEISLNPKEGFKEFDLNEQIISPHIDCLNQQSLTLDNFRVLGEREIKSQLLTKAGTWLETQIAKFPAESAGGKFFSSDVVKLGMSRLGVIPAAPMVAAEGSFMGKFLVGTGFGDVAGFIQAKTGVNLGIKLAAKEGAKAIAKTGLKAAISKITTALSTAIPVPVLNWIIGFIGGEIIGKILEKINWAKVKEWGAAIIGGVAGLIALPFVGIGAAIGIGVGATAVSAGLGAGLGGATLAGIGSGIAGFFGALGGAFLGAIGMPIMVTLLVFPVVVALVLFIINSGAYLVPPSNTMASIENPYIGIEKTATPSGPFENVSKTITYKVTITAKKGILTNTTITEDCKAVSKTGSVPCPTVVLPSIPDSISPANPFVFNYSTTFDQPKYSDSLVVNTITVTAIANETSQTAKGGTTVIFGKPPSSCLKQDGSWPAEYDPIIKYAITTLSSDFAIYMSKVCSSGDIIPVVFSQTCPLGSDWCYGAWHQGKIYMMPRSLNQGDSYALFTLAHETGHYLQSMTGQLGKFLYDEYTKVVSPPDICSYGNTIGNYTESFAETIGRYASNQGDGCFNGSFKKMYPNNWQHANDKIFK